MIQINGTTVTAEKSARIGLAVRQNTIEIAVANGSTQARYSVALERQTLESFGQSAYIKASNAGPSNVFGTKLALSGNTLVVGAPYEDSGARGVNDDPLDGSASDSGAAYVFVRDAAGTWTQQAYLKAANADPGDNFGSSVAISGDVFAIGAPGGIGQRGWIERGSSEQLHVRGGYRIHLRSQFERAIVATSLCEACYYDRRRIVRRRLGAGWQHPGNRNREHAADYGLGSCLYPRRQRLLESAGNAHCVGRRSECQFRPGVGPGRRHARRWIALPRRHSDFSRCCLCLHAPERQLERSGSAAGSNTDPNDNFGASVALSGNTLAVSAPGEDSGSTGVGGNQNDNSANDSGAVYVFERDQAGSWNQTSYIKASNTNATDLFGYAISLSSDWLAVGADNEAGGAGGTQTDNSRPGAGAGYLFVRDLPGAWSQQLYVKPAVSGANDRFGRSVAVSNFALAFAAPFEDSNAAGVNGDPSNNNWPESGAVYVLE